METRQQIGFLLGAGASYECAMPLTSELTAELRAKLTPEKLRDFNQAWHKQGGGHPESVIEALADVWVRPGLHYESILGFLETQFRRNVLRQDYHALYSWLIEAVYWILYTRHLNNVDYIQRNIKWYSGLARLACSNPPVWIFSLNHDLIIECLAAAHGIPVNSGFGKDTLSLPRRDRAGKMIGELRAQIITDDQLEQYLAFSEPGSPGINLLKLHGALDVFAFGNHGKDLVKLLPLENTVAGVLDTLRVANKELVYREPRAPGGLIRATNEIAYADESGEMHFLRRTLLAGAFKFDKRESQVLPAKLLDHFRSRINAVTKLGAVGYSFGDIHVNQVLREWLEFKGDRLLEIVQPDAICIPDCLLHLAPQIKLVPLTASEYFDCASGITRTNREILEKRLAAWARAQGNSPTSRKEFAQFIREFTTNGMREFARDIAKLTRDRDIDLATIGTSAEDFASRWASDHSFNVESMIGKFLATRQPPST